MSGLFYHDVIKLFRDAKIPMVVVGGVALNLRGIQRSTSDLDLAISLDSTSLPPAVRAVQRLGLVSRLPEPESRLCDPDVVKEWVSERNLVALKFTDPRDPWREVDLVVGARLSYSEIEHGASRLSAGGLSFLVASARDLVRLKTGTGRTVDADDVADLNALLGLNRGR